MRVIFLFLLICLPVANLTANSEQAESGATDAAMVGDAVEGQKKAVTCNACHGADGNSVNPIWPKIAGQHAKYTAKQLHDFKNGSGRVSAEMSATVSSLSDQDILDLAAYFAAIPIKGGVADDETAYVGKRIYEGGNHDMGIPACSGCHGPAGQGDPAAGFPKLAGQHADYLEIQLKNYRNNVRSNDQQAMMRNIAARMTPDEISAVSNYIQGLRAR